MPPYRAPQAPMRVVAAKVPEVCIIRAFSSPWGATVCEMIEAVLRHVGTLEPNVEWTGYTYEGRPLYWHAIVGVNGYGGGVFRWNYTGHDTYRDFAGLLHRPRGWASI